MTQEKYDTGECDRCSGTGRRYDATMADKVCAAGDASVQCSTCRGTGVLSTLRPDPLHVAMATALASAAQPAYDAGAELPEWMM
jgi:DnaJ-class molecular chaperone